MQANAPEWIPNYEERLSWENKLFILYLLVVCGFAAVRATRVMWFLWRSSRDRKTHSHRPDSSPKPGPESTNALDVFSIKVTSLRRMAIFTFFVSLLVLLYEIERILLGMSVERATGNAALAGATSEALTVFALRMLVCTALYGAFALLEELLARRKMR